MRKVDVEKLADRRKQLAAAPLSTKPIHKPMRQPGAALAGVMKRGAGTAIARLEVAIAEWISVDQKIHGNYPWSKTAIPVDLRRGRRGSSIAISAS